MAWYYGTFSCGHEGRVNIIGPSKDREWKKERAFIKDCPECYQKSLQEKREKCNQEALIKSQEMELAELEGTEKQVAWANTLRLKFIEKLDKMTLEDIKFEFGSYEDDDDNDRGKLKKIRIDHGKEYYKDLKTLDAVRAIRDYILENKTKATFYIDKRYANYSDFVLEYHKEVFKSDEDLMEEEILKDLKIESTVQPENCITPVVVEITATDTEVAARFEKNEKFRLLIKKLKYEFKDGLWKRSINNLTGSAADRAAELGNKLLNAGFPICIMDTDIRNAAIAGTYEPECDRWISIRTDGKYEGYFSLRWWDKSDIYDSVRKLPGSRYDSPYVVVRIEHCDIVEEFAELYKFKFTDKALKAIAEYKEKIKNIVSVNPVKTDDGPKDGLKEILNSSADILDDLRDDV